MRECTLCKKIKPLQSFYKQRGAKNGRRARCMDCCKQLKQEYKAKYPERVAESRRRTYEKYKSIRQSSRSAYARTLSGRLSNYKNGAKQRNLLFELTKQQFANLTSAPCYYCGSELDYVGIDRIDTNKGYIYNNVVPCCFICNKMKNTLTIDQFIKQIDKIHQRFQNEEVLLHTEPD